MIVTGGEARTNSDTTLHGLLYSDQEVLCADPAQRRMQSGICQLVWHVPFECSSSREQGLFSTHSTLPADSESPRQRQLLPQEPAHGLLDVGGPSLSGARKTWVLKRIDKGKITTTTC